MCSLLCASCASHYNQTILAWLAFHRIVQLIYILILLTHIRLEKAMQHLLVDHLLLSSNWGYVPRLWLE